MQNHERFGNTIAPNNQNVLLRESESREILVRVRPRTFAPAWKSMFNLPLPRDSVPTPTGFVPARARVGKCVGVSQLSSVCRLGACCVHAIALEPSWVFWTHAHGDFRQSAGGPDGMFLREASGMQCRK